MSRQSKAFQKAIIAKQFTALHLSGQRGPKQSVAKHGKQNTELVVKRAQQAAALKQAEANAQNAKQNKPASKNSKNFKGRPTAKK